MDHEILIISPLPLHQMIYLLYSHETLDPDITTQRGESKIVVYHY